jgi:hypothetical protein
MMRSNTFQSDSLTITLLSADFIPALYRTVSQMYRYLRDTTLVEFIAATFLVIYRSTMDQARSYVAMLEKINAVGMSIQILDKIKTGETDKFRAQLAMELLFLYGLKDSTVRRKRRYNTNTPN